MRGLRKPLSRRVICAVTLLRKQLCIQFICRAARLVSQTERRVRASRLTLLVLQVVIVVVHVALLLQLVLLLFD